MLLGSLLILQACAGRARPCVVEPARIRDRERGIPETTWDSEKLLAVGAHRRCQVLFEPTWAEKHAVWIGQSDSADVPVVVTNFTADAAVEEHVAELDRRTANRLVALCARFLRQPPPDCRRIVVDGTWYHAAHELDSRQYLMRSFDNPRKETLDAAFVSLAESLRDYAMAAPTFRRVYWWRIQEAEGRFSEALDRGLTD